MTWLMPVASIVPLIFVIEVANAQDRKESHDVRQQGHENVKGDQATDGIADNLSELVFVISIH